MKYAVVAAGILLLIILAVDLSIPLGVAAGFPYIAVVLTAWWMADRRAVFVLAALSTLFVIIGYFFSQDAGIPWMVVANRAMAIFAIWTTATLLLMAKRSNERLEQRVQKRTRELRQSEARLLEAQRIASIGSWQQRIADGTYGTGGLSWSDETFRIFGLQPEKQAPTAEVFFERVHPDDRNLHGEAFARAASNNGAFVCDHRIVLPSGEIRYVQERGEIIYDDSGTPVQSSGTVQDVTEQTQIEEQLRQAQKMEVVGQLTGGVAHDFNNLLTVIVGSLEFVRDEENQNSTSRKMAELGIKAAERGAALTHRLLAFSRKQALMPTAIDLNMLIIDMSDLLRRTMGERIEIRIKGAEGLWACQADQSQLENALLNLTINARDAMPDGGLLTIETANLTLGDEFSAAQADVEPGDYVMLGVSDSGTGIPPETLKHVFEPFFTTKEVGKGSGLGLSMVYGFAKQSGGNVTIYSEPGDGTTVKIYLPRSTAEDNESSDSSADGNIPTAKGERILIVEDNPDVRTLAVAILSGLGYEIVEAGSAQAGLDAMAHSARIDLLLSDVVLPGNLNGPDLAAEVRRRDPTIKIVFMTGYAEDAFSNRDISAEQMNLIQKPFGKADLANTIRRVLDS